MRVSMIDPNNYSMRVWDSDANHVADYRLQQGMLMALSQLGLLQRKTFSVKQPNGKPNLTATILHSTNFKCGGKYSPDKVKELEKLHIMPDQWISFDEVGEGMLWSSEYLVSHFSGSNSMYLTTKRGSPKQAYLWVERIGLYGPVDSSEYEYWLRELESAVKAVKLFESAPANLRDWMLGEISPMIKVKTSLEIV